MGAQIAAKRRAKKTKAAAGRSIDIEEREPRHTQAQMAAFQPINSAVLSVALNGTEVRLYVSWKRDYKYHMASVENFLLHWLDHCLEFHKYVQNIIDWERNERLQSIQRSLDTPVEMR